MTPASITFRSGAPRSRSPNGVDQQRRVNIAFLPDERDLLGEIARLENRTVSAAARHLMILGARAAYPELHEQFTQPEEAERLSQLSDAAPAPTTCDSGASA